MVLSYIANAHPSYIDSLYEQYQQNEENVELGWRKFFEGFDYAQSYTNGNRTNTQKPSDIMSEKEFRVLALIEAYRRRGHFLSTTNPIRPRRDRKPALQLQDFNLTEADLNEKFAVGNELGLGVATLQTILDYLKNIYLGNIGFEFGYINDQERYKWLLTKIEAKRNKDYGLSLEKKRRILEKLNEAVVFENFLGKKYIGQKRFSLEGGETTIPALDAAIIKGGELGVEEVVIGMAHRGRLNVLANIMGKTYEHIFNEFEGKAVPDQSFGNGDVKYHLGYSSQIPLANGKIVHLKLTPNPSHLEAVNPVVEGFARAKADILYESDYDKIMPILIHGDAAVAGQGIVYEVTQMSELEGYYTGGTLHFVINNQIGFTTDYEDARSSKYCTSVATLIEAPVFHVNGDDPEAVIFAMELATEYRQHFNKDIFIDMVCYRRHGHNESDEPQFTQPNLYNLINKHDNPRDIYLKKLEEGKEIEMEMARKMNEDFWAKLQERLDLVKEKPLPYQYQEPEIAWKQLQKHTVDSDFDKSPDTSIERPILDKILTGITSYPESFNPLVKIKRLLATVKTNYEQNKIDWATAELLAYGSILAEEKDVRLSGEDVKRGTFSHRHAVIFDADTNKPYSRLAHIAEKQGKFRIYNSLLSEFAVLGFEFGYAMASPNSLVIWEAQFGDFANGAQTIIDQFIASSESKWQRMNGLVMLLPHGYEGQGPEHSSARLERFLQLCAENNMTIANITTPANLFHLLRRQLVRPFRKPLVIMSPKSLLRHPLVVSPIDSFINGGFQELLDDTTVKDPKKVKKIIVCSGKVYYDLWEAKEKNNHKEVAIVRLEQIYPFPKQSFEALLQRYPAASLRWVQEEPLNAGAWQHIATHHAAYKWSVTARPSTASPAAGAKKNHDKEQALLMEQAFS